MEIILLERIERLGQMGDVVTVKSGYARNFLLPQNKALRATDNNKKRFDKERAQLEAHNLERRGEAEKVAEKMSGEKIVLLRQAGESGQLYGSVNARDIAEGLSASGFATEKTQVQLAIPIKTIGLHEVSVNLHPEVSVTITANVARSADEAETQSRLGRAVLSQDEEEAIQREKVQAAADAAARDQAEAMFEEGAEPETATEDDASSDDEVKSDDA